MRKVFEVLRPKSHCESVRPVVTLRPAMTRLTCLALALAAPFGRLLGYRPHPSTSSAATSPPVAPIVRRHSLAPAAGHQEL